MKLKLRHKLVHRVNNFWKRGNCAEIICLSLPDDNRLQQIEIIHLITYVCKHISIARKFFTKDIVVIIIFIWIILYT